jgi:hypothetical protein
VYSQALAVNLVLLFSFLLVGVEFELLRL